MASRHFAKIGHPKKRAFLAAYARVGTVLHAAEMAKISREMHRLWLQNDPEYAAAFEEAKAMFAERLEREALRRAVEGVEEPIYQNGQLVGTRLRHSDKLLELLLKGHLPSRYRERQDVHITSDPVTVRLQMLNPDDLQRLAELAQEPGGDGS